MPEHSSRLAAKYGTSGCRSRAQKASQPSNQERSLPMTVAFDSSQYLSGSLTSFTDSHACKVINAHTCQLVRFTGNSPEFIRRRIADLGSRHNSNAFCEALLPHQACMWPLDILCLCFTGDRPTLMRQSSCSLPRACLWLAVHAMWEMLSTGKHLCRRLCRCVWLPYPTSYSRRSDGDLMSRI